MNQEPEPPAAADDSAASRLCSACGLCCNGVMFQLVKLQPRDSAKALAAVGLKLKRKGGNHYIQQPCPAYRSSQCSIYHQRPERCRLFECKQLHRVATGEISEATALSRIQEVKRRVGSIEALLELAGSRNQKRSLTQRCEKVHAEPVDPATDPETVALRAELATAMSELEAILALDFRNTPISAEPPDADPTSEQADHSTPVGSPS